MIWIVITAVSFFAFMRQLWLLHQYRQYQSRGGSSCCEMARLLLDKTGFPQVPVQPAGLWERFRTGIDRQLFLPASIYGSRSLYAVAQTSAYVVALSHASGAVIPVNLMFRLRTVLRVLLVPAWVFFALEIFTGHFTIPGMLAKLVLQGTLLLGVFELSKDWEASAEALDLLKQTEIFEPDELVKLRGLLSAIKWRGLAEIFKIPFDILSKLFNRQETYGV